MWICLLRNICFPLRIPESAHYSNAASVRTGARSNRALVRMHSRSNQIRFTWNNIFCFHESSFFVEMFCARSTIVDRRHFVQLSKRRHFAQLSACRHRTFERRSYLRPKRARRSNACTTPTRDECHKVLLEGDYNLRIGINPGRHF